MRLIHTIIFVVSLAASLVLPIRLNFTEIWWRLVSERQSVSFLCLPQPPRAPGGRLMSDSSG